MMKTTLLSLAIILFLGSCKDNKNEPYKSKSPISKVQQKETIGKTLMDRNCNFCHNPTATKQNRIAPPIVAVKRRYLKAFPTKNEFVEAMLNWSHNPSKETALMYGAIDKFGVMPKIGVSDENIKQIASYIFDNDMEKPIGFDKHHNTESSITPRSYKERGLQLAMATKTVLGQHLMSTIQKKGTIEALQFCNLNAMPLTDSLSNIYNASIKRVSDKARNPTNMANSIEKKHISSYKEGIIKDLDLEPIIVDSENNVSFYYPIKTNTKCLQCHGLPEKDIQNDTYTHIKNLYPNDLAIGYKNNEIRGIWSISFEKNQ